MREMEMEDSSHLEIVSPMIEAGTTSAPEQFAPEVLALRSVIERRRGNIQHAEALEWRVRSEDPTALSWANARIAPQPAAKQ